ncbi:hypothetical protein DUNSADRAFT_12841 [Dunaliella salina]|uniref:Ionotropic glutamate receptor C-terminal domain-containing protein n=1 Tax=Dunaliella salina TaxID=3046 RepID=A0ABQ7H9P5_DUNSA|nr:hypothetical protein DUNSADRAFT_12841 [Dunaliella salina]|eukprot:KAF5843579.1 hypothetical protein DUNSADRAFT_12841 [Dunaliella salina]
MSVTAPTCMRTFLLLTYVATSLGAARDWCPVEQQQSNSSRQLQEGLSGMRIRCGAVVYPPFSAYDESTGAWSGYDIELFNEVAKRGNFEYEIVVMESPPAGESYDTILFDQGRDMDILCTWWGMTASRERRNIRFAIKTVDTSFVLVTPAAFKLVNQAALKDQFWIFLEPFSRDLWLVLLFGVVFTAIFLYIVDPQTAAVPQKAPTQAGSTRVATVLATLRRSIHAALNLMSQGWVVGMFHDSNKNLENPWSKLYQISWASTLIVLLAVYIAQLTRLLDADLQSTTSIKDLDDLVRSNKPICALTVVPFVKRFIKNAAPFLPVVPLNNMYEAFPAMRAGKCKAALFGRSEAEIFLAENELCDMRVVGGPLNSLSGAYAADAGNCGPFVLRVVDALLQGLRDEGLLDEIWDKYTELPPGCTFGTIEDNSRAVPLRALGGLFIIHAAIACVAISGYSLQRWRGRRHALDQEGRTELQGPPTLLRI